MCACTIHMARYYIRPLVAALYGRVLIVSPSNRQLKTFQYTQMKFLFFLQIHVSYCTCTYSGHVLWYFLHAVYCVCIVQSTKFKADLKSISPTVTSTPSLSLSFFFFTKYNTFIYLFDGTQRDMIASEKKRKKGIPFNEKSPSFLFFFFLHH